MFDEICSEIRDIIHDAVDASVVGTDLEDLLAERGATGLCIQYVDDGLALTIGEDLYSINIQKV